MKYNSVNRPFVFIAYASAADIGVVEATMPVGAALALLDTAQSDVRLAYRGLHDDGVATRGREAYLPALNARGAQLTGQRGSRVRLDTRVELRRKIVVCSGSSCAFFGVDRRTNSARNHESERYGTRSPYSFDLGQLPPSRSEHGTGMPDRPSHTNSHYERAEPDPIMKLLNRPPLIVIGQEEHAAQGDEVVAYVAEDRHP